ncbi:MAG: SgcJ/EcaC family oxidoreductase [Paludisphaera borealis]|uniref:YybH family protein n=1 Tax=Paludisphaera borealis TaxID=1387353 RepID=UPI00285148AD|nr:SgcJ/EcaC family oxidoreductase [Paludisphaera borealis]MDR3621314.1 SgcJ/EcaC family oxidoreductase [Paludisphaera borealis]
MRICSLSYVGMVLLLVSTPAMAQTGPKGEKTKTPALTTAKSLAKETDTQQSQSTEAGGDDLAAIRKSSQEFTKAFDEGDAHAIAALWTEDGDYSDTMGQVFKGRAAIEKEYGDFFAAKKGFRIQITIDSLRLLSPTAAIEDGHAVVTQSPAGTTNTTNTTKYVVVHVKVGEKWLMSTARDTLVETPSTVRELDDMEWLIGSWVAEDYGSRTESVCRWVANKSFVERSYTVKHPDESTTSGIQLIGFNSQGGHIQSWNFSSDGGFAVGVWTRRDRGWSAEISGITGAGISTTAVNVLTRLDNNAYSWQSVSRTAGGISLPDTDEIVIKRTKISH